MLSRRHESVFLSTGPQLFTRRKKIRSMVDLLWRWMSHRCLGHTFDSMCLLNYALMRKNKGRDMGWDSLFLTKSSDDANLIIGVLLKDVLIFATK